jgi:DNA-binding CsgD family transcriptional regulator
MPRYSPDGRGLASTRTWTSACPHAKLRGVLGIIATALADARTSDDVLHTTVSLASRVVASRGQAAYLLDGDLQPTRTMASDLPDRFLSEYERFGRADDPLMDHLLRRRTAVTERDSGPEPTVCARWGMGRILIVPLFGEHGVAGSLNLVRPEGAPGFTAQEQLAALALAGQASVSLARCEREPVTAGLTAREQELLRLLGEGLRNREIASLRGVSEHAVHQALKRLYRKLGVRSRAAAVATAASWNGR